MNYTPLLVLEELAAALRDGFASLAVQQTPHIVLLDPDFYRSRLQPLVARWALYWLHENFVGACSTPNEVLLQYLSASSEQLEALQASVQAGLLPESLKMLNLARDWVRSYMPHIFSKINRVS